MAPYANQHRLGELGIKPAALASIPSSAKETALEAASRRVDGYLSDGGWVVPLVTAGIVIERCVAILATYDIVFVQGFRQEGDVEKLVEKRYLEMIKWLEEWVAEGAGVAGANDGQPEDEQDLARGPRIMSNEPRGWTERGASRQGIG